MKKKFSKTQKLTISAMVMAIYIVVLYFTQSFSFGAYQIRIVTALYALSYFCPFLVLPLGLANFIANTLFGGLGILDMVGGCLVGLATSGSIAAIRKYTLPKLCIVPVLIFIPGLGVATWLSYYLNISYGAMAFSLCVGQSVPAVCGWALVTAMEKRFHPEKQLAKV
jgi:uncharacterized membrane protein